MKDSWRGLAAIAAATTTIAAVTVAVTVVIALFINSDARDASEALRTQSADAID